MLKKILKMTLTILLSAIGLLVLVGILFVNLHPAFGDSPTKEEQQYYESKPHYQEGKFINMVPTSMDMSLSSILSTLKQYIEGIPNSRPNFELPVHSIDSMSIVNNKSRDRLIWFGHSAFLLEMKDQHILIDPMLGEVPAPHPWLGGKRYSSSLPIELEKLPHIDVVIISHDHYDHLDYESILALKAKTKKFLVPLGVAAHLRKWGVAPGSIREFNWWESVKHQNMQFTFTPARHFSGRGLSNRNSTLWGGWVINGNGKNLFFSGDSGYGDHFKTIGEQLGPFDFSLIECGQYNEKWKDIHMMPEESAQAAKDVGSNKMMPIHWGAFSLALHSWVDPVERVLQKAKQLNQEIIIPEIGENIWLDELDVKGTKWWQNP
jgi:L-ascorbate metabolism protein UlaG (beta-lactamase superfamily)